LGFKLRDPAPDAKRPRVCGCDRPWRYDELDGSVCCAHCGRPCSDQAEADKWWKGDERFGGPVRSVTPFDNGAWRG
jgi:hypothetical protein